MSRKQLYDIYDIYEETGLSISKQRKLIEQGVVTPTIYSYTGRHKFSKIEFEKLKQYKQERDKMIRACDIAKIFSVSPATIVRYVEKGILSPCYEDNKTKYFDKAEVEKLAEELGLNNLENYYSAVEVADLFEIEVSSLYYDVRKGKIRPDRITYNGKYYFLKDKINEIIESVKQERD